MRRIFLLISILSILFVLLAPLSFSEGFVSSPQLVDSALTVPVPTVERRGGGGFTTYTQYYVNQSFFNTLAPSTILYRVIFTIPSNEDLILRLDGNQKVCINVTYKEPFQYRVTSWDVISGKVTSDTYRSSSYVSAYVLDGYSQAIFFRNGYLVLEEGIYGSEDAFGYPISNLKTTVSSADNTPNHAWDTNSTPYVSWARDSYTVMQFINRIFPLPDRYSFIGYVVGGVLLLILLDGLINFLFGTVLELSAKRRF